MRPPLSEKFRECLTGLGGSCREKNRSRHLRVATTLLLCTRPHGSTKGREAFFRQRCPVLDATYRSNCLTHLARLVSEQTLTTFKTVRSQVRRTRLFSPLLSHLEAQQRPDHKPFRLTLCQSKGSLFFLIERHRGQPSVPVQRYPRPLLDY